LHRSNHQPLQSVQLQDYKNAIYEQRLLGFVLIQSEQLKIIVRV
jgi:hypothetical protein